jgi:cytosine/adenosine deaminase-related metal-dependent hydrolase
VIDPPVAARAATATPAVPPGGGRIAARFVVAAPDRVLAPGEVVWDRDGRIVALRRARARDPIEPVCVLPGLVDAHVHLQLAALSRAPRAFVPWIGAVLAARAAGSAAAERRTIARALASLRATGTTAVGEIDSSGTSAPALARSALAGRCYRELTGFHLGRDDARTLVAARWRATRIALRAPEGAAPLGAVAAGLSPHAPYSVSPELLRAAAAAARHLAIHCAEVEDEQRFLHTGRGPFADLLARLGRLRDDFRAPGVGAVRWLEQLGVLRRGTQLVHCQHLERGDAQRIACAGAAITVCPGTIAFFARDLPPVPAWLALGIPVALGTDSLASNRTLSMRAELRAAARAWPEVSPRVLLAMATTNGGEALGLPGLGRLRRNGRADLLVVPAARTLDASLAAFVHGEAPLLAVRCAGRVVRGVAGAAGAAGRGR